MESYPVSTLTNILKIVIYDSQTNIPCGANMNFTGCENLGHLRAYSHSVRSFRPESFGPISKASRFALLGWVVSALFHRWAIFGPNFWSNPRLL